MEENKKYDLEERTFLFANNVRLFVKKLSNTPANTEDSKQVIRSSGSVAANYIEENDALGIKDKLMRMKISRKEARESKLWLRLLDTSENAALEQERKQLQQEAHELMLIFGAIINKLNL
ncbi:MAG: four helix bundle protein [Bacteroidota bacterium]